MLLGALVLETASLACFSGLTVSLLGRARRPRFGTLLRIDVTVYGLSRVLPAAAATGGALRLRLRLLTAAGVSHPDAVFLATIEGTGSALLLYVMMGVALIISLPVHGFGDPRQILAAVAGVVVVAVASALLSAVARDGRGLRRLIAWLARWVPGMNADHATATLHREAEHLRALAADPPRLVAAVAWGAANWLLDGERAGPGLPPPPPGPGRGASWLPSATHSTRSRCSSPTPWRTCWGCCRSRPAAWASSRVCSSRRSWPRVCPPTSRWSPCWPGAS